MNSRNFGKKIFPRKFPDSQPYTACRHKSTVVHIRWEIRDTPGFCHTERTHGISAGRCQFYVYRQLFYVYRQLSGKTVDETYRCSHPCDNSGLCTAAFWSLSASDRWTRYRELHGRRTWRATSGYRHADLLNLTTKHINSVYITGKHRVL